MTSLSDILNGYSVRTTGSRLLKIHPATIVLGGFVLVIAAGAVLLMLPVSTTAGSMAFIDALFTATSAVCVTGLVVVDTGTCFTRFGQCVILALIQIGGLGVMTISVALFRWVGRSVSFRHRMILQDLFAPAPREDIFSLVRSIAVFTAVAEIAGAVVLTFHWSREYPLPQALYTAVFHSVSAFCNAGFSLYSDSMMRYSGSILLNVTLCALIVTGGIGFPVLYDLKSYFGNRSRRRVRLSIQTKTVLLTSLVLIAAGALMFAFLERRCLGTAQSGACRVLAPVFQAVTCRTAGFNTLDIASMSNATLAMMIFLMFFGASPGSCGGGVKTTTLALITAFTFSRLTHKRRVNMFKKSIPEETISRSISLIVISVGLIGLVLFMLLAGDPAAGQAAGRQESFVACLFETVSAFATVGLSMGLTPELGAWGKCWIIFMMIVGRVGVLTFSYSIVGTGAANGVEYSEENLMIG